MGIRIEFRGLENLTHSEYFLTGFYQLEREGRIAGLKVGYAPGISPKLWQRIGRGVRRRLGANVAPPQPSSRWGLVMGTVRDGLRERRFAIDILDGPWHMFGADVLENVDIYFKCQYPTGLPAGVAHLNRRVAIPLPGAAVQHAAKIRPLMLGRPLGRRHDFAANLRLLDRLARARREGQRDGSLLMYLGMAFDTQEPVSETHHHPHLKRADLIAYAAREIPSAKIIFSLSRQEPYRRLVPPEAAALATDRAVGDEEYFEMLCRSSATLNIAGLHGSIPFRAIDSFLGGILLISDSLAVAWHEPLLEGCDYLSIGDLGYEVPGDIDLAGSCARLRALAADAERLRAGLADKREARFQAYYSPTAAARYMLMQLGFPAG